MGSEQRGRPPIRTTGHGSRKVFNVRPCSATAERAPRGLGSVPQRGVSCFRQRCAQWGLLRSQDRAGQAVTIRLGWWVAGRTEARGVDGVGPVTLLRISRGARKLSLGPFDSHLSVEGTEALACGRAGQLVPNSCAPPWEQGRLGADAHAAMAFFQGCPCQRHADRGVSPWPLSAPAAGRRGCQRPRETRDLKHEDSYSLNEDEQGTAW